MDQPFMGDCQRRNSDNTWLGMCVLPVERGKRRHAGSERLFMIFLSQPHRKLPIPLASSQLPTPKCMWLSILSNPNTLWSTVSPSNRRPFCRRLFYLYTSLQACLTACMHMFPDVSACMQNMFLHRTNMAYVFRTHTQK
jgi:hypothetical protein